MRKFKACSIRGEETAIGIVEYVDGNRTAIIHSVYYPENLSGRETYHATIDYILEQVDPDDQILLRTSKIPERKEWLGQYTDRVKAHGERFQDFKHGEAMRLAKDALQRKTTIKETII